MNSVIQDSSDIVHEPFAIREEQPNRRVVVVILRLSQQRVDIVPISLIRDPKRLAQRPLNCALGRGVLRIELMLDGGRRVPVVHREGIDYTKSPRHAQCGADGTLLGCQTGCDAHGGAEERPGVDGVDDRVDAEVGMDVPVEP